MSFFKIEAAIYQIPLFISDKFVHGFWILRNTKTNQIVAALHGLATSRTTGEKLIIGYSADHSLKAHHTVYDRQFAAENGFEMDLFSLPWDEHFCVYEKEDALLRWKNAVNAISQINHLNLNYPRLGVNFFAWDKTVNSNSIYRTFADCMAIETYQFNGFIYVGIKESIFDRIKESLAFAVDDHSFLKNQF